MPTLCECDWTHKKEVCWSCTTEPCELATQSWIGLSLTENPLEDRMETNAGFKAKCLKEAYGIEGGIREAEHIAAQNGNASYLEAAEILRKQLPR